MYFTSPCRGGGSDVPAIAGAEFVRALAMMMDSGPGTGAHSLPTLMSRFAVPFVLHRMS